MTRIIEREAFHRHLVRLLPVYVFVTFYFTTTVIANIAYFTPIGSSWPTRSIEDFSWKDFSVSFGFEFWALLLMPLILVPIVSIFVSRATGPLIDKIANFIKEIPPLPYTLTSCGLYSYVFIALHNAHALSRMISATNARDAVGARFVVLAQLGYWPQLAMQSLLIFLTVYAVVNAARTQRLFWKTATIGHIVLLSICLILLNMKWPIVLFCLLLGMCVLSVSKKRPLLKSAAIILASICMYLLISVVLLRLVPTETQAPQFVQSTNSQFTGSTNALGKSRLKAVQSTHSEFNASTNKLRSNRSDLTDRTIEPSTRFISNAITRATTYAPMLFIFAINRMALSAPFYYDQFTRNGAICGTILDRVYRHQEPCQPSNYIYEQMFGQDKFAGVGTSPAAVNFSGYALNGFPGALVETILAGIIIGCFVSLYVRSQIQPILLAALVMGSYAAYFMTQLPIEGAVVYAHGILGWGVPVFIWSLTILTWRSIVRLCRQHLRIRSGGDGAIK